MSQEAGERLMAMCLTTNLVELDIAQGQMPCWLKLK
jgi:hypothetical protein